MILVTEKISEAYPEALAPVLGSAGGPLLVTVPSTGGSAGKDRITRYIREAIGIKV